MWLIATTITLFIANVCAMADEYSGTILQRQPPAAQCHTAVTSHRARRYSSYEPQIPHLHSSTVYCHSVTAADGTDGTQNKMYSAAAFHCTDRQCTVESTVDTVWCWCY